MITDKQYMVLMLSICLEDNSLSQGTIISVISQSLSFVPSEQERYAQLS